MRKTKVNPLVDLDQQFISIKKISLLCDESQPIDMYHFHKAIQIVLIDKGRAECIINEVMFSIDPQSVVVIGDNLPHSVISVTENIEATVIHVAFNPILSLVSFQNMTNERSFIVESKQGLLYTSPLLYQEATCLFNGIKSHEGFRQVSLLFELFGLLHSDSNRRLLLFNESSPNVRHINHSIDQVDRIYRYLYEYYDQSFSLTQLADYANMNKASLCRAFKKKSGLTIIEFVNKLRVEKACQLLTSSDLTVSEIAYKVGYNTYSHFNDCFYRIWKISPGAYRKKAQCKGVKSNYMDE